MALGRPDAKLGGGSGGGGHSKMCSATEKLLPSSSLTEVPTGATELQDVATWWGCGDRGGQRGGIGPDHEGVIGDQYQFTVIIILFCCRVLFYFCFTSAGKEGRLFHCVFLSIQLSFVFKICLQILVCPLHKS